MNKKNTSQSPSTPSKLTIKNWNEDDRPREKFLAKGMSALTNAELLAILLRSGTRESSALEVAQHLLRNADNSLNNLANNSLKELTKIKGVGEVKAISLLCAFEIAKRMRVEKVKEQDKIISPRDLLEFMQDKNAYLAHEEFWVIYLNNANVILAAEQVSIGGFTGTLVDVRVVMKRAIEINCTGMILCHNHPSGNLKPSSEDITVTKQVKSAAEMFQIKIIDHVIVSKSNFTSFAVMEIL